MLLKIKLSVEKCIDDFCILCNKKYESDDEVAERIKIGAISYKKFLLKFKGEIDKENVNFAKIKLAFFSFTFQNFEFAFHI